MSAVSARGCLSPPRYNKGIDQQDIAGLADKAVCQATTGWTEMKLAAETESNVGMSGLPVLNHFAC